MGPARPKFNVVVFVAFKSLNAYTFKQSIAFLISLTGILCFILALICVVVLFVIEFAMAIVIVGTIFNFIECIDDLEDHFFENDNKPLLPLVTTIRRTVFGPNDSGHETIDIGDGMEIEGSIS